MNWIEFLEKWIWLGFAAIGFAILFNVPRRTLWVIFVMGALGGATKLLTLKMGGSIVLASFLGATLVGFLSIPAAHIKHSPPFIFAIPSVIPMVPGAFAYQMMLGLIRLTNNVGGDSYTQLLESTVNNGLKALFVLMALAIGVSVPMLITRSESAKKLKVSLRFTDAFQNSKN